MSCFRPPVSVKTLSYALYGLALFSAADSFAAVSQSPLSLTVGVPPNLILTLDDSGSMREAFVPEDIESLHETRRAKSPKFNTMYYDPNVEYKIPKIYDANGLEIGTYSTSFSNAYFNGYNPDLGGLDLRSNYKVSWWYKPAAAHSNDFNAVDPDYGGGRRQFAVNPLVDFVVITGSPRTRSNLNSCTPANGYIKIGECTVQGNRNNRTYTITEAPGQDNSRRGVPAYYYEYNKDLAGCDNSIDNDDCYRKVDVIGEKQQKNFAIWYSFYRNRALATLTAARLAFAELSPAVRFTWQSLNACKQLNGTASGCGDNRFREYSPAQRGRFFSWLDSLPFYDGTPLRGALVRAGEFLKGDTAWHKTPNGSGNTTANTYACRPSYHVLMTDGIWNGDENISAPAQHDGASFTLADNETYNGTRAPYADSTSTKTLADYAMHYWANDLRPGLDNNLPPFIYSAEVKDDYWDPRNDPATWQHMVNFTMGLGLSRSLNQSNREWAGATHSGTGYQNLLSGNASWPKAEANSNNNVYDLWHAAINSRGEFFSVDSPNAMVQAFDDILSRIAGRKSSAARPAINSGQISTDENNNGVVKTVSYQTSYASDDNWSGDVKRFEKTWNAEADSFETSEIWSAKSEVPGWQNRNIYIASEDGSGLASFDWDNAGAADSVGTLAYFLSRNPENNNVADALGPQRLDYLRGNREGEGTTFRRRSSVLGDFYSSSPAVVFGPRYLVHFSNKLEGNTAYSTFATNIAGRTPRLYVGGNDGMLHGFNALTGVEEFAFVPSAVFHKLNKLTGNNYSHEFYVDGSPVVADVYNGTEWRTILVGTLKAGGRSIFALDITTPGSEELLWEFDDSSLPADAAVKMGYSFSQPTIARLHTGTWAVVFGNGYESANNTNGKAALFIVDAMEGTLLKSLEVEGVNGIANGLSTPKLADYNADGVADYAYAGDLQGNVWRFDLLRNGRSDSAPFTTEDDGENAISDFEVAYGGAPLFSAVANTGTNARQPITSAPSLVLHPTGFGYLVVFGTGKFFETGDKEGDKSIAQTVYGIWDKQTLGEEASDPNISRSSLQMQEIVTQTTVEADGTTRQGLVLSANNVRWQASDSAPAQDGWYLNLRQSQGEMVVENMSQLGRTIFFQTLIPNDDPCGDGANNWTYAINPFTGGRTSHNAFDYRPTTDIGTTNVSAIRQDGEGGGTLSQDSDGTYQYCTGQECVNVYPDPASLGRQSWRRVEQE